MQGGGGSTVRKLTCSPSVATGLVSGLDPQWAEPKSLTRFSTLSVEYAAFRRAYSEATELSIQCDIVEITIWLPDAFLSY
jgi:hypothetical protein